jgi:hypothetical protein
MQIIRDDLYFQKAMPGTGFCSDSSNIFTVKPVRLPGIAEVFSFGDELIISFTDVIKYLV